jgi:hypothetical protein
VQPPDRTQLAICDTVQRQWLVDIAQPARRFLGRIPALASAICFASDGRLLLGTLDRDLLCWSLSEQELEWQLVDDER